MASTLDVRTLDGDMQRLSSETLDLLEREIDGSVHLPGEPGYLEATTIWNGAVTRRPALVVRPENASDVARVVAFCAHNGLETSLRGGGHNIAGLGLSDGGVTIDFARMTDVAVDPGARLAAVAPGCTLGDVDTATQKHGLAATLGFVSLTGVAGLTVGGGFGYLTRQFGWTVDDLREVEIVTADGRILRASADEHDELFWAIRGGGGNFGAVTRFTFALHDVGPDVTAGLIAWSADEADEVLGRFAEVTRQAPRELTAVALMRNAPPAPWLSQEHHGRPMVGLVVCHTGSEEEAARDLAPIRSLGRPWADLVQRKDYAAQQSMLDATQPKGMAYYWKSEFLPGLNDELLEVYRAQFEGMNAPANQIVLFHLAGALSEHAEDDGAVGNRDAAFACVVQSMAPADAPSLEGNRAWVRGAWEALRPFSTGGNYVNFQTADEAGDRVAQSYRGNLERLSGVKRTYDPGNFFRVNRNITPR